MNAFDHHAHLSQPPRQASPSSLSAAMRRLNALVCSLHTFGSMRRRRRGLPGDVMSISASPPGAEPTPTITAMKFNLQRWFAASGARPMGPPISTVCKSRIPAILTPSSQLKIADEDLEVFYVFESRAARSRQFLRRQRAEPLTP